jgi:hypothetical protein
MNEFHPSMNKLQETKFFSMLLNALTHRFTPYSLFWFNINKSLLKTECGQGKFFYLRMRAYQIVASERQLRSGSYPLCQVCSTRQKPRIQLSRAESNIAASNKDMTTTAGGRNQIERAHRSTVTGVYYHNSFRFFFWTLILCHVCTWLHWSRATVCTRSLLYMYIQPVVSANTDYCNPKGIFWNVLALIELDMKVF